MKILIISRSFYPLNSPRSFRTTELVKEFFRLGYDVTLYTHIDQKQDLFLKKYNVKIKNLPSTKRKQLNFGSGKIGYFLNRISFRFFSNYFDYPSNEYYYLVKNALKEENNYDLLISIAVPHTIHWGVAKAIQDNLNLTKTWIADCGDPYLLVENDTFQKPFYFKFIERWWAKNVNFIAVPVNGAIGAYDKSIRNKIKVIPQGFNFDEVMEIKENYIYTKNSVPTFIYGGGFIPKNRDPRKFLEFLNNLEINFKFYIYTNNLELVNHYVDRSNGKIEVLPMIPRKLFLEVLQKMDFVVNFENKGDKQTPSKLIDYGIMSKPILSISSNFLDKETINNFLKGNYQNAYIVNDLENYNIRNVVNKFLNLHFSNVKE